MPLTRLSPAGLPVMPHETVVSFGQFTADDDEKCALSAFG